MVNRDILINQVKKILGRQLWVEARLKDDFANGVQFYGSKTVDRVSVGVSLNQKSLQKTVDWHSNFCIFHHGFDPTTDKWLYPLYAHKRLKLIIQNDLTIMGLHYVLDTHPKLGNNALIIEKLGAKITDTFFDNWGFIAKFDSPRGLEELERQCEKLFDHSVFSIKAGSGKITTVGVVSGAGRPQAGDILEMQQKGVDLFISGETSEAIPDKMSESGINYFACGHWATEVFGVVALGDEIQNYFGDKLEVKFINLPNPV